MDILFKNRHTRNKELAREFYRYYHFQRPLLLTVDILIGISLFVNILSAIFDQYYSLTAFVMAPLLVAFQFFCYYSQSNAMLKRDLESHGKEVEVETVVTDEYVQHTASTGAVNKIDFSNITGGVQTKNLILLRTKANLVCIFRKDTFECGTKEEFIEFLKSKGISVKGK